jgi:hypothetical protein
MNRGEVPDPTIFWLCSATLILALFAWLKSQSPGKWWWGIHLFVLLLAILSLGLQIYRLHIQTDLLRTEQTQVDRIQQRVDALERAKPVSTTK